MDAHRLDMAQPDRQVLLAPGPQPLPADQAYPQAFEVQLSDHSAHIYFDVDDTGLHWSGVYTVDYSMVDTPVSAQYAYLTGEAIYPAPQVDFR